MISTHQPRLLVVDDDPKSCDLLTTRLNLSGFTSQSCTNGEAALKLLSTGGFDAIISDLNMPGVSGLQLLEAARRLAPRAAFLMAIGVGDVAVGVSAMKQGAADYILKPFQMEAVMVSLGRALKMKRMEAERFSEDPASTQADRERNLLEAYRRVTTKRMSFSTTTETMNNSMPSQGHSERVSEFAAQTARQMGLPGPLIEEIRLGGVLHDIGISACMGTFL